MRSGGQAVQSAAGTRVARVLLIFLLCSCLLRIKKHMGFHLGWNCGATSHKDADSRILIQNGSRVARPPCQNLARPQTLQSTPSRINGLSDLSLTLAKPAGPLF